MSERTRLHCFACKKDCTTHFFMCDQADPDTVWCPACFDNVPCGQGLHGEGCPTQVMEADDAPPR